MTERSGKAVQRPEGDTERKPVPRWVIQALCAVILMHAAFAFAVLLTWLLGVIK